MGPVSIIELSLDSTTFTTKETNVVVAYAPTLDLAAYLHLSDAASCDGEVNQQARRSVVQI